MTQTGKSFSAPEGLNDEHQLNGFDCGEQPLDEYLKRYALINHKAEAARTYVVCRGASAVVGYYSLSSGSVEHDQAPPRISKGIARHPIPIMLLARLAVDKVEQGKGLGKALLKDALMRTAQVADIAGVRALLVHAKHEQARAWYEKFEFEPSPTEPLHLFLLMKDLRAILAKDGPS